MKNIFTLIMICFNFLLIANNNEKSEEHNAKNAHKEVAYELTPPPPVFVDSFFETFSDETVEDWVFESAWTTGESEVLSSQFFAIPEHGTIAVINDDAAGLGVVSSGKLISPPIIRIPDVNYLLNADVFFTDGDFQGDETATIETSTDGENWTTILSLEGHSEWDQISLIILPSAEEDTLYIAFNYNDGGSWNFGFGVDDVHFRPTPNYFVNVENSILSKYTKKTLKQVTPLVWEHVFQNLGNLDLSGLQADLRITTPSGEENFTQTIPDFSPQEYQAAVFNFTPEEIGEYEFYFSLTHPEIGTEFFSQTEIFEVSDSLMAKDDGTNEGGLGFGFGDPSWYGYYGAEFELTVQDTVTAISIYISPGSTIVGSSINLTINGFNEAARPAIELYHSEDISLESEMGTDFLITYQLPKPVVLAAGLYLFAAGQDTLQGIVGFQFDFDRIFEEGFWLISPIAGGGYPWANANNREALMIRPHLKSSNIPTATNELNPLPKLTVFPNPFKDVLHVDFPSIDLAQQSLFLTDLTGKRIDTKMYRNNATVEMSTAALPAGIYFIHWMFEGKMMMEKIVKQ